MEESWPKSKVITTLHCYDTVYSADSVEWCPLEPYHNIFVCGTYQLEQQTEIPNKRLGRILLFSLCDENGLKQLQLLETAAILDQKWCPNLIDNHPVLGVVNAMKTLQIYRLNSNRQLELLTSCSVGTATDEILLLSLDWSCNKYHSNQPEIICSDSRGAIHRFTFVNNQLILENSYKVHEYEAWITAFYYWDPNIYFSGGDDCLFCKYDKRLQQEPIGKNRNSHEAGVTSMHSNCKKEFLLATGSYDSNIRLWDIRYLKTPTVANKLPGTLWRLKWDPFEYDKLLAACMLGGIHIVDQSLNIIDSYYEHKNISYGADWSCLSREDERILGTCSFYDHLLCVSKIKF